MERKSNRALRLLEQLGAWVHGFAPDSTKERRLHHYHSVQRGDLALAGVTSSAYALGWDLYLNPAWEYPASGRLATAADLRAERGGPAYSAPRPADAGRVYAAAEWHRSEPASAA
jgi:hypothetical protein